MAIPSQNTTPFPKRPEYIEGVGWRYPIEHRMTRWPQWKDIHKPGTYMFTLNINGGQKVLGSLAGTSSAVYKWMKEHPEEVKAASSDALYYRHALLGRRAMPWVLPNENRGNAIVETMAHKDIPTTEKKEALWNGKGTLQNEKGTLQDGRETLQNEKGTLLKKATLFDGVSTPSHGKSRTHFPIEALMQPDAPHIVLSPLGEAVKKCLERMPEVVPQIEMICYTIMPNHIHFIIAVKEKIKTAIGSVIRSFMGITSHILHQMINEGKTNWNTACVKIPNKASEKKPPMWQEKYCIGICYTEQKLHTRIGYVLENPFFGVLESEHHCFMARTINLNITGRKYCGYGNMLLLKEPDRMQVFCHRKHSITNEPYHLTQDFLNEKQYIMDASANGVVIVTPGISPGEQDIMWAVLRSGGNVINIQKEEIPLSDKWHPEKERRIYCSQGRLLVLSVNDLPHQTFHDKWGYEIPTDTKYAKFHLLNFVAEEICREGIEHEVRMAI